MKHPMAKNKVGFVSHLDLKDKLLGKAGTPRRDAYEKKAQEEIALTLLAQQQVESIGDYIRALRKAQNLKQEEIGEKIGVTKSMISKLEKGGSNATIETLLKVFNALGAKVMLQLEIHGKSHTIDLEKEINPEKDSEKHPVVVLTAE